MKGGLPLRLLAVFTLLVRCQQKPQVILSTTLNQTFIGDLVYLKCNNTSSDNGIQWYLNGKQTQTGKFMRIVVTSSNDLGPYQCESNGEKSENFTKEVSDFTPMASLTIHSGEPVMPRDSSVNLMINNEDGLKGWLCWSYKNNKMYKIILKKVQENSQSHVFEPRRLSSSETIIWCTEKNKEMRSNQITLWTSDKEVLLEMYHNPAIAGEVLTLKCMVWGTDQIERIVFYKDNKVITQSVKSTYDITDVTDSTKGNYMCNAIFTYKARTSGPSKNVTSDSQEVFVQGHPMTAALDSNMRCSCSACTGSVSYRYYKQMGQSWVYVSSHPSESGTYRCRAVCDNVRSFPSAAMDYSGSSSSKTIAIIVVILLLLIALVVVFLCLIRKKRQSTGAIYEDVGLQGLKDKDEDKYQTLQEGRGREAEYDTLKPEASGREKKEGEYEPLKKGETKEGVYHTLGMEGAAGGEGGYEALKKEGMKEGVYHTLGKEGATGGDGGYEALKKEGMKEGVYHTLGKEEAAGGDGGYEALKKEGMKEGVYHTLSKEEAAGEKEKAEKKDKESEVEEESKV